MNSLNTTHFDLEVSERWCSWGHSDLTTKIDGVVWSIDIATPVEIVAWYIEAEPVLACEQTTSHWPCFTDATTLPLLSSIFQTTAEGVKSWAVILDIARARYKHNWQRVIFSLSKGPVSSSSAHTTIPSKHKEVLQTANSSVARNQYLMNLLLSLASQSQWKLHA